MVRFIAKYFFQKSKLVKNVGIITYLVQGCSSYTIKHSNYWQAIGGILETGNRHVKNVKGSLEFDYGQI